MSASDRIKAARSKEELAEAVEPVALQLALIAEETLPKIKALWSALEASGGALSRIEALKALERDRGRRGLFIGLLVAYLAAVAVGVIVPLAYQPLQTALNRWVGNEQQQQIESDAQNWSAFVTRMNEVRPTERQAVLDILGWE